ncbi:hypothetical protein DZF91_02405 [Actinomadura logoneensis]|uniref:Uncharacterized protein n=1 Tax=Actinomadura logoneensis TaxID=2293572 RepID=A0A372JT84_9ACTN|nr:hypothetical protein [Actinomadura logoneensis]RFU43232.1 hypothetical protein DZF91_02405 [Actinomadura logoneensis]
MPNYSPENIRMTALPAPVRRGRWWVHSWTLESSAGISLEDFTLPEPLIDFEGATLITFEPARGVLVIRVSELDEVISAAALVYVAQIVNLVRDGTGAELAVNGDTENPLFDVVRE